MKQDNYWPKFAYRMPRNAVFVKDALIEADKAIFNYIKNSDNPNIKRIRQIFKDNYPGMNVKKIVVPQFSKPIVTLSL